MKATVIAILGATTALVSGCVQQPTYSLPTTRSPAVPNTMTHVYKVSVKDAESKPIENAAASFEIKLNGAQTTQSQACTTNASGECVISIDVPRDYNLMYSANFKSSATITLKKDGYYTSSSYKTSDFGSNLAIEKTSTQQASVTLLKPTDYLLDGFGSNQQDKELREQSLKFLSLIRLQSFIVDASIVTKSIGTSKFKGHKYFTMKINTDNTYNSLKLDKYQIAKTIFDESIRKILNPLNDNISNPRTFHGYDLIVYGYTKSFADKYAVPSKIEYRFLLPQEAVRKYKNKDISGQQLIDQSIVLMNDERIDLKLM